MTYTHGLDKVYSFETIDPGSVRKMNIAQVADEKSESTTCAEDIPSLDLFPTATKLFLDEEPIDSLRLSPFALQSIKTYSIETVKQLNHMLTEDATKLRSIGQGHLDEMRTKIHLFLKNSADNAPTVDMTSAVRLVLSKLSVSERAQVVSLFDLKDYCFVSVGDEKSAALFVKRLNEQGREEFFSPLRAKMKPRLDMVASILQRAFIKPYLSQIGGIASIPTLSLALFAASGLSSYTEIQKIHAFFQSIISHPNSSPTKEFPWFLQHTEIIDNLFVCASSPLATSAKELIVYAQNMVSLTKKPIVTRELVSYLWKHKAKQWNTLDRAAIEELIYWSFCPFTQIYVHV